MQTGTTTKALLGIIALLGLGSPQAGMAFQEESIPCSQYSPDACRVQAEAGDAEAQAILGLAYDTGQAVPEDDAEAMRWYRTSEDRFQRSA
jgi:TPR repeat protein